MSIIEHGAVDNRCVSIIGRLRYNYVHASLLFQARYQLYIGRIQSTEILVTSRAIKSEESPDTTGYTGLLTVTTAESLSHCGRKPALFILFF